MALPNIFDRTVADDMIQRINTLTPDSQARWGKMNVAQMLAHCNVSYELTYEGIHPKPNFFMGLILKGIVKNYVVSEKPYTKNMKTAPAFIISDSKNFDAEKQRLINYINKTVELGEHNFDGRPSHSFGKLSKTEWSNMFYKHLDHHLAQFGV
jgi:hypothetical protein